MTRSRRAALLALSAAAIVVSACLSGASPQASSSAGASAGASSGEASPAPSGEASPAPSAGDPATDLLAHVLSRGTLVGYTATDYPPQSMFAEGATRAAETKCQPNELTAPEVTGFDAETTKLVGKGLGVETCFVVPTWTVVTAGNWDDRFDIAYGSGSINEDRMTRLWMTQPYYGVPNHYFVRADSAFQKPADLEGKQIGSCSSCSHEAYLKHELKIPGIDIVYDVQQPILVTYETEPPGLEDVAEGDIDAFLCAEPVGAEAVDAGLDLRRLDAISFTYYPSGFVDKSSGYEAAGFVGRVNEIIRAAQADGTMKALSLEFFGTDYATAGAEFDLEATGQQVE